MQFYQNDNLPGVYIREHSNEKYPPRTKINASSGDVTLALAVDMTTKRELLTKRLVEESGKIYLGRVLEEDVTSHDIARALYKELRTSGGNHLNVAGNSIHTLHQFGCDQDWINYFVFSVIEKVHEHYPLAKIVTGGQTGVDMAGAIAGAVLGIHTEVTFPKGFRQRTHEKEIYQQSAEDVFKSMEEQVQRLQEKVGLIQERKMTP